MSTLDRDFDNAKKHVEAARNIIGDMYYSSGLFRAEAKPMLNMLVTGLDFVLTNIPIVRGKALEPKQ